MKYGWLESNTGGFGEKFKAMKRERMEAYYAALQLAAMDAMHEGKDLAAIMTEEGWEFKQVPPGQLTYPDAPFSTVYGTSQLLGSPTRLTPGLRHVEYKYEPGEDKAWMMIDNDPTRVEVLELRIKVFAKPYEHHSKPWYIVRPEYAGDDADINAAEDVLFPTKNALLDSMRDPD